MCADPNQPSKRLYALADVGNRYYCLLSEHAFKNVSPQNEVVPSKHEIKLSTAGGELLPVLGQTRDPITFTFNSTAKNDKRQYNYTTFPYVVQSLALPCILSARDMMQMKAKVDMEHQTFQIPINGEDPICVPMCHLPKSNIKVSALHKVKIKSGHEAIIPVKLPFANNGYDTVLIEGDDAFLEKTKLMMCASINKPEKCKTFVRVWNCQTNTITINKDTVVGIANPYSEHPGDESLACSAAALAEMSRSVYSSSSSNMCASTSKATGASELNKENTPRTQEEIYKRLYDDLDLANNDELSAEQKHRYVEVFRKNRAALALGIEDLGCVKGIEVPIETVPGAVPVRHPCSPVSEIMLPHLQAQVTRWLNQGVAELNDGSKPTPWASRVHAVRKRGGGWRWVIDYTSLNRAMAVDSRPVHNIQDRLARLKKASNGQRYTMYCNLDCSDSYSSLVIKKEDRHKTAAITPLGVLTFNRLNFGLSNACQSFHRVVQLIEQSLMNSNPEIAHCFLMYFDDIMCTGSSSTKEGAFDDLLSKLDVFLQTIAKIGLRIQVKKTRIGSKVRFLGHLIDNGMIKPDPDLVSAILKWDPPETLGQLATLIGTLSYFRRFIRDYSGKMHSILELKKAAGPLEKGRKNVPIKWDAKCQEDLDRVLQLLVKPPILVPPDYSEGAAPLVVTCDTSSRSCGGVLSQTQREVDDDGKVHFRERIIAYASKKLTPAQSKFSSYKLELYGILSCLNTWRYFLLGRPFLIRTDHKSLEWLAGINKHSKAPASVFRWRQYLADYDFRISFVPSSAPIIRLVDGLSRRVHKGDDGGNMPPILPRHDILCDDDFDPEMATTSTDDQFWSSVMKAKVEKPTLLNVVHSTTHNNVVCSRPKTEYVGGKPMLNVLTRSKKQYTTTPPSSTERTSFNTPTSAAEEAEKNDDDEGPPPARFLTDDETWDTLSSSYSQLSNAHYDSSEIDYNSSSQSWWMSSLLCHKSKLDKVITFLKNCCLKVNTWPTSLKEIKECVTNVLGPPVADSNNKFTEYYAELSWQQRALNYYLREHLEKKAVFKMSKLGNSEIVTLTRTIDNTTRKLMVIPYSLRRIFIQLAHHSDGNGFHLGVNRTLQLCHDYYTFYDIRTYISDYVSSCKVCADGKRLSNKYGPGMGRTSSNARPRLKHFSLDIIHMPKSRNYQYLLSVVCTSTLWVECYPLVSCHASKIGKIIENELIPRFGEQLYLSTDCGTNFLSKTIKRVCEMYKSRIYHGTPYRSASTVVERVHRSINSLIRMMLIDLSLPKSKWCDILPRVLYCLRASMDSSSNTTAFSRVYGFNASTMLNSFMGLPPPELVVDEELVKNRDRSIPISYPEENSDLSVSDNTTVYEDDKTIVVQNQGLQRKLAKIPGSGSKTYYAQVSFVNSENVVQESQQAKRDLASEKRHFVNKQLYDKVNQPKHFRPLIGELLDYLSPIDSTEDNIDNRKLANYWSGCYAVRSLLPNAFSANVEKIDLATMKIIPGSRRRVYLGSCRPSLMLSFNNRPHSNTFRPEWEPKD